MNWRTVYICLTDDGGEFRARAAATGNAQSPSDERRVEGMSNIRASVERGRRCASEYQPTKRVSEVRRDGIMKTTVEQNTHPKLDSFRESLYYGVLYRRLSERRPFGNWEGVRASLLLDGIFRMMSFILVQFNLITNCATNCYAKSRRHELTWCH